MPILRDALIILLVTVGGAAAVAAYIKLAMFPGYDAFTVVLTWLIAGMLSGVICLPILVLKSLGSWFIFLTAAFIGFPIFLFLIRFQEPTNPQFRWWLLYLVWLYVWWAALVGWRAGWVGLLLVTLPALLLAGGGLFFVAGFLLPFPAQELYRGKRTGRKLGEIPTLADELKDFIALLRYPQNRAVLKERIYQHRMALRSLVSFALGTNFPYYVVIDEKITERTEDSRTWLPEKDKLIKRLEGDLFGNFMAGPGIILTGCDHAVAISTGFRSKGAKGPGIVFTTHTAESPTHVLDLRTQLRAFPVEALTKDGIAVQVTTFLPFRIGAGNERPELSKGFPYRTSDAFKAIHANQIYHVSLSQTPDSVKELRWYDLPELFGERIIRDIISRYSFDELYAPFEVQDDSFPVPRVKIAAELRERLDTILPQYGIQRMGGGIGNLLPKDPAVIERRIETWQSGWTRKIMLQLAEGQSRRLRYVEQARAQAQIDLVLAIGKRLGQLRDMGMNGIANYFIMVLEELANRPTLRHLLPQDVAQVLRSARRQTNQAEHSSTQPTQG
ncbi:MAG: SPFH domain-containing protein [Anaerolineae bacterium]|nr:SPFH domain-containing protein [Anaerolineae bacterium]